MPREMIWFAKLLLGGWESVLMPWSPFCSAYWPSWVGSSPIFLDFLLFCLSLHLKWSNKLLLFMHLSIKCVSRDKGFLNLLSLLYINVPERLFSVFFHVQSTLKDTYWMWNWWSNRLLHFFCHTNINQVILHFCCTCAWSEVHSWGQVK